MPAASKSHFRQCQAHARAHTLNGAVGSTPIEHSEPVVEARNNVRLVWNSILERLSHLAPHCPLPDQRHYRAAAPSAHQDLMYAASHLPGQPHGGPEAVPMTHFRGAYPVMLRGADGRASRSSLVTQEHSCIELVYAGMHNEIWKYCQGTSKGSGEAPGSLIADWAAGRTSASFLVTQDCGPRAQLH